MVWAPRGVGEGGGPSPPPSRCPQVGPRVSPVLSFQPAPRTPPPGRPRGPRAETVESSPLLMALLPSSVAVDVRVLGIQCHGASGGKSRSHPGPECSGAPSRVGEGSAQGQGEGLHLCPHRTFTSESVSVERGGEERLFPKNGLTRLRGGRVPHLPPGAAGGRDRGPDGSLAVLGAVLQ